MIIKYYPHQKDAINKAVSRMHHASTKDLIEVPTGGGKTYIIAGITAEAIKQSLQVMIVTPRKRLLEQTRRTLSNLPNIAHGVMSGEIGSDTGHEHPVIIGTQQTLIRRDNLATPNLIIVDEVHLMPEDSKTSEILSRFPKAKVIGLTATPYRGNEWLSNVWKIIHRTTVSELIKNNLLARPVSMGTESLEICQDDDVSNLSKLTSQIIDNLLVSIKNKDRKKVLVFARDIDHAHMIENRLLQLSELNVGIIHSEISDKAQKSAYEKFEKSLDRAWLINVNLVTVGVDIQCIDAIAIIRNVTSLALLIQIIGRGLRICREIGKTNCLIYDYGKGTNTFGFIDAPKLPDGKKLTHNGTSRRIKFKTCKCGTLAYWTSKECKACGELFPFKTHLSANSNTTELLSPSLLANGDIIVLTIANNEVDSPSNGNVLVKHRFNEYPNLFALTAFRENKNKPSFSVGTKVVCDVIDLPLVDILSAA